MSRVVRYEPLAEEVGNLLAPFDGMLWADLENYELWIHQKAVDLAIKPLAGTSFLQALTPGGVLLRELVKAQPKIGKLILKPAGGIKTKPSLQPKKLPIPPVPPTEIRVAKKSIPSFVRMYEADDVDILLEFLEGWLQDNLVHWQLIQNPNAKRKVRKVSSRNLSSLTSFGK